MTVLDSDVVHPLDEKNEAFEGEKEKIIIN